MSNQLKLEDVTPEPILYRKSTSVQDDEINELLIRIDQLEAVIKLVQDIPERKVADGYEVHPIEISTHNKAVRMVKNLISSQIGIL